MIWVDETHDHLEKQMKVWEFWNLIVWKVLKINKKNMCWKIKFYKILKDELAIIMFYYILKNWIFDPWGSTMIFYARRANLIWYVCVREEKAQCHIYDKVDYEK